MTEENSTPEDAPAAPREENSGGCSHCGCTVGSEEITDIHSPSMKYQVGVHYGYLGITEHFATGIADLRPGDMVVMKSARGIDHGAVTTRPVEIVKKEGIAGAVIRRLTDADRNILEHVNQRRIPEEKEFCIAKAKERKMTMKIVATEHLLGGDKIIFYFIADGRVDFRELVKDLARRYRTRIEMRQIGVRDEARMLSDYEHCGRELCCRTFLRDLEPVTMRMAKMQKSTLDPSKISGHCGRLMCCLRYEDSVYQESQNNAPRNGQFVTAGEYTGRVVGHDLSRQVEIELADGSRVKVPAAETRPASGNFPVPENNGENPRGERRGREGGFDRRGRRERDDGNRRNAAAPEATPPAEEKKD